MNEKRKGLLVNLILYIAAFAAGLVPYFRTGDMFRATACFTATATLVIYIATCFYPDTSLYDPYWSVAPPVMLLINILRFRYFGVNAFMMLSVVCVWSVRLTGNWAVTYKGLGHEDWRYAMYRERHGRLMFAVINCIGLQYIPTVVVYLGLVNALCVIRQPLFRPVCLLGYTVMLAAVALEFIADRAIHRFLRENRGTNRTCDVSVWNWSRHPNYLGEMMFWTGMFLVYTAVCPVPHHIGLGFLSIIALFCFVSIPMMERHNLQRRSDYVAYRQRTPVLIPYPARHRD